QFGAHVVGVDVRRTDAPPGFASIVPFDALDQEISAADLVVLAIPHTPMTEGLISAARLARFSPSAYLVNIGRGPIVQLDALNTALDAGQLAGAALDVFETEPLPSEHPLWRKENVLITPHVAGAGPHSEERRFAVLLENARRFVDGRELVNVV